jgi:hypothetical protein
MILALADKGGIVVADDDRLVDPAISDRPTRAFAPNVRMAPSKQLHHHPGT